MKLSNLLILVLSLGLGLVSGAAQASTEKFTFFAQTQYPLTVYFLKGDLPGPTVMVQGGIQGDESSGFICAQLLTKAKVLRGNLILVPRANVPSINVNKRQINVDLNRRFDQDYNRFFEDRLARVIRLLLSASDAFIHLHEGSGFYNPTYVDELRNPKRYGQSVIIDSAMLSDNYRGVTIDMASSVKDVLERLNSRIDKASYHFNLFNMETLSNATLYPEQRKSLTCHAVRDLGIPALAIEVSKSIGDLTWKVEHQLKAAQFFLAHFGVEIVMPNLSRSDFKRYPDFTLGLSVNGQPLELGRAQRVTLRTYDKLDIAVHNQANSLFDPVVGVFASDRPGLNLVSAPRMAEKGFDKLEARADGVVLARLQVKWEDGQGRAHNARPGDFICWLNGELKYVREGQTLTAYAGDQLILDGVYASNKKEILNLKGYVSESDRGDGQDIGAEIILDPAVFLSKHLLKAKTPGETLTEVVRETRGMKKSRFFLRILPRSILALHLQDKQAGGVIALTPGESRTLPEGEYVPGEIIGNGTKDKLIVVAGKRPLPWGEAIRLTPGTKTEITVYQANTFTPLARFELGC